MNLALFLVWRCALVCGSLWLAHGLGQSWHGGFMVCAAAYLFFDTALVFKVAARRR